MDLLAVALVWLFPDDAKFHRNPEATRNFYVFWPLHGQPANKTQWSNSISIYFSNAFLLKYWYSPKDDRATINKKIREIVKRSITGFDEGRNKKRFAPQDSIVIDTSGIL